MSRARGQGLLGSVRAIDRLARPVHAVWELTLACDLACNHCGSRAGRRRPDELSREEALDLVAQLAAFGVKEVALIGGEAYLYPHWDEVVRAVRAAEMACVLVTGGRGFSRERAVLAKDAGVQSISVSLDGDEPAHDALRGVSGSYRAARAAIETCRSLDLPVALNSQLNRRNQHCLVHMMDVLFDAQAHGWPWMLTIPMGGSLTTC